MKYMDEYRDQALTAALAQELHAAVQRPMRIMEVCGTHTNAIFRHGLRSLLPADLQLISGPGCPVCVTPAGHVDAFVSLAQRSDTIIATFGDLLRVPGTQSSLLEARSEGGRVEIVYSPMDALLLAQREPNKTVIFLAVGFETTTPGIAATVLEAERLCVENFTVFPSCKTMPQPLEMLMQDPEVTIDGLLCPGHVSVMIGARAYQFLVEQYGLCCAVAGFEATDILRGLLFLANQFRNKTPKVENAYTRAVGWEGNLRAQALVDGVFESADTVWRGLGTIPRSGLAFREAYRRFDAIDRFKVACETAPEPKGCRCGEILAGRCLPTDCPLFKKRCSPTRPVGPCMVSSEGTCAAYFRYGYCLED